VCEMGDALLRKPISGFACCCCARAASGHNTAVLPKNAMNSRRLMASPRRGLYPVSKEYHALDQELCRSLYPNKTPQNVRFTSESRHRSAQLVCPICDIVLRKVLKPGGITMKLPRRQFLHLAASAAALPLRLSPASAIPI